jgi:hypothetical protein
MPATLVTSVRSRSRLDRARRWLQARDAADEVLILGASLGAANELARSLAQTKGAAFGWHRLTLAQLAASRQVLVRPSPGNSTGTVVSSPRIFSAAKTCRRMASTIGGSSQTAWPTQSHRVERSRSRPSRASAPGGTELPGASGALKVCKSANSRPTPNLAAKAAGDPQRTSAGRFNALPNENFYPKMSIRWPTSRSLLRAML